MSPATRSVPAGVFLVNAKNEDFIYGRTSAPVDEYSPPLFILRMAGVALTLAFVCYWMFRIVAASHTPTNPNVTPVWVGLITIGGYIVYRLVNPILWHRKFQRGCSVLCGDIVSCKRLEFDEGPPERRLKYRFRLPEGEVLEGTSRAKADERPDPAPGVAVAAYLNVKTHRLL
jgi:hypothetical protein